MNAEPSTQPSAAGAVTGTGVTGEGRVLTREGWPVTGASVTLLGADGSQVARAVTGGDGGFALLGVPAGAATMLVAAAAHDPRATSVVVPADGDAPPSTDELDRTCLDRIARYKRPKDYRFVDALPTNNYGKVVKRELHDLL